MFMIYIVTYVYLILDFIIYFKSINEQLNMYKQQDEIRSYF